MPFPLVLDGFPRCGSTTLARILDLHPDIQCCVEPFHPKRFGGEFHRLALQAGSVTPALSLLEARWNALKHVWEPETAWPFRGQQQLNDELVRSCQSLVSLRRRNLLRQIVSNHISKNLGFWIGTRSDFRRRLDSAYLPPLPVSAASKLLESAVTALESRDRLLSSLSSRRMTLYYEDLFEVPLDEQIGNLRQLFIQLGLAPVDHPTISAAHKYLDPSAYKWADNDSYDRVPGIRLVEEQLGADATGWLFR